MTADDRGLAALAEQAEEELVIRDWLAGQLSPSGAPLPPSRRTSTPLPRRQVTAVVATLVGLLDEARQVATDYITALNDCRDSGRFSPDGGLDAAWAEVEAGYWRVRSMTELKRGWEAVATDGDSIRVGHGPTPAEALRALAARLATPTEEQG